MKYRGCVHVAAAGAGVAGDAAVTATAALAAVAAAVIEECLWLVNRAALL
jgi:hypothetical protein